jgi:two-component system sensor histidine kinase YesM
MKIWSSRWYINMPLRHKLMFWFAPLFLFTIGITGAISYHVASNEVIEKMSLAQMNLAKKTMNEFNYLAQDAVDFTNYLFLSSVVSELLDGNHTSPSIRQKAYQMISSLMVTRHSFQSMIIYKLDDPTREFQPFAVNQTGITSAMTYEQFRKSKYYDLAFQSKKGVWVYMKKEEGLFVGDKHNKILFIKVLKNVYTLEDIGIIVLGIDEIRLKQLYGNALIEEGAEFFLFNPDGTILTSSNGFWSGRKDKDLHHFDHFPIASDPSSLSNAEKGWIVSHVQSDLTGWHTVIIQNKKNLLQELNRIRMLTVLVMSTCFLIGLIICWYLALLFVRPIEKLTLSMKRLQKGDFSQRVQFHGNDEIGILGQGYDTMVQRIKELIDDVYKSKLKQKEAELRSLQAQINPHFLYNTLNTICWTAQQKGEYELAEIVYSLSQVFRLSLNDGEDQITIHREVEMIRNYLYIQQIRFQPRFTYEIDVDPSIQHLMIPKLLLQPLVENAIIHGIEPLDGSGLIHIKIYMDRLGLFIEVTDNGVGIPEERLNQIKRHVEDLRDNGAVNKPTPTPDSSKRLGWALTNIKERLVLTFGSNAKLHIHSSIHKGTQIQIVIPSIKERSVC